MSLTYPRTKLKPKWCFQNSLSWPNVFPTAVSRSRPWRLERKTEITSLDFGSLAKPKEVPWLSSKYKSWTRVNIRKLFALEVEGVVATYNRWGGGGLDNFRPSGKDVIGINITSIFLLTSLPYNGPFSIHQPSALLLLPFSLNHLSSTIFKAKIFTIFRNSLIWNIMSCSDINLTNLKERTFI